MWFRHPRQCGLGTPPRPADHQRGGGGEMAKQGNVGLDWPVMVRAGVSERLWSSRHHNRDGGEGLIVEFGESVLLQSPAPDFSMPYNVITLTSTVLALFFGRSFLCLTLSFACCTLHAWRGYCTRHIKVAKSSLINVAKASLPHEYCRAMNVAEATFHLVNLERTLLYIGRWLHL